jgi:hypothetical protein
MFSVLCPRSYAQMVKTADSVFGKPSASDVQSERNISHSYDPWTTVREPLI